MTVSSCQVSRYLYTCTDIQPIHIDAKGISALLFELVPHKASGPDGIPTRLIKELAYSLSPVLALIFNASLHHLLTGRLPQ